MQNSSSSITKWQTRHYYSVTNGVYSSSTQVFTYPSAISQSFSYTGFGPNPDPKKNKPVAGTYEITRRFRPQGVIYDYTPGWGRNYSAWTAYGDVSGLVGDWSSSYCRVISSPASLLSDEYMNWAYNDALSKIWEAIKQSETNIALTLGEGRETGRMFKVFRSVDKVVKAVRKARKLIKHNPSLLLAQTHLSVKYGWTPLFNDIWNYADWTYKTFSFGVPFRKRSRKRLRVSQSWSDSDGYTRVYGNEYYSCEIGLRCYVNDPNWFTASRLTSLNPATIAWELTTLSFVVDWLYDIGSYLQNLENALATGLTFQQGYVTRVAYQECRMDHSRNKSTVMVSPPGVYRQTGFGTSSYKRVVKRRDVLSAFPMPRKPTFHLRMGAGRILSAAALSRTILLGKVR